jgi:hypothetical protein
MDNSPQAFFNRSPEATGPFPSHLPCLDVAQGVVPEDVPPQSAAHEKRIESVPIAIIDPHWRNFAVCGNHLSLGATPTKPGWPRLPIFAMSRQAAPFSAARLPALSSPKRTDPEEADAGRKPADPLKQPDRASVVRATGAPASKARAIIAR